MVNELDESVALITLEEARLYCYRNAGDSSRDELLIEAINDVSASIRDYCDREFVTSTGSAAVAADPGTGGLTLDVAGAAGIPAAAPFEVRVDDELMLVTAVAGDTWTVTRGYRGTTPAAHAIGAEVAVLEARSFRYNGSGALDLSPFDLRELYSVTLYTDLDEPEHDLLESSSYRLSPVGGTPAGTWLALALPVPALDEAAYGFGWETTVLGRWGMLEVPGSVKLAAKIWVDNIVKNPAQAASETLNGYSVFPEVDEEGRRAGMPPASRYRLDKWARHPGGGSGRDNHGVVRFTNDGETAPGIPNTLPLP